MTLMMHSNIIQTSSLFLDKSFCLSCTSCLFNDLTRNVNESLLSIQSTFAETKSSTDVALPVSSIF